MPRNMGSADRLIRLAVAVILAVLVATGIVKGGWTIAALVIAGVFALTSLLGFCPLYLPLGISTRRRQ